MAELVKPWNDGGSLSVTYDGDGDGSAVFSSDSYEGIDRTQIVVFRNRDKSVAVERIVRQEGTRERFLTSDRRVFFDAASKRLGVIKGEDTSIDYLDYLTIESLEDGLLFQFTNTIEYCIDADGKWKILQAGKTSESINAGQTVSFRANLIPQSEGIGSFTVNKEFNLCGNVMSIIFGDEGKNIKDLTGKEQCFYKLFYGCQKLKNIHDNFLPATTLAESCYGFMFNGCTSLVNAPELPATTLASKCYQDMFHGCRSLVNAPELPATTLAAECYYEMFYSCTSLVNAPELPATTLAVSCYSNMFYDCTSLVNAPELPVTTLTSKCYNSMFHGCRSLVNAPELPATTLAVSCYSNMFSSCTSLVNTPELPATTLTTSCYSFMFNGCRSLVNAPELPATTLAAECYSNMFYGCTSLVNAPELPATLLQYGSYRQMFYGCEKLNYIKCLLLYNIGSNWMQNWVYGVATAGTFVKSKDAMWEFGPSSIPEGWTVQNV